MPRDMFGDVVDPSIKMGNKMWYTVPLTMLLQATIVAAIIIVPLMAVGALPTTPSMMAFVAARMDPSHSTSAADLLAQADAAELKQIFRDYGEERWAGRIAREIVRSRSEVALRTTRQLAELVCRAVPGGYQPQRIHPATRVFQALRIAVNGELEALPAGLAAALRSLRPGGRLVVISFHSLEDRLVKQGFRAAASPCSCPPRLPVCVCHRQAEVKILTARGVRPSATENIANPRARSAVLRADERLAA